MAAMLLLFSPGQTSRAYLGTDTRMAAHPSRSCAGNFAPAGRPPLTARCGSWTCWARSPPRAWPWPGAASGYSTHSCYHGGFWLTELAVLVLIACAVLDRASGWRARFRCGR